MRKRNRIEKGRRGRETCEESETQNETESVWRSGVITLDVDFSRQLTSMTIYS